MMSTPASHGGMPDIIKEIPKVDLKNKVLDTLATSKLENGKDGFCVATTHANMKRLKVDVGFEATGEDPNNPRGGLVQMIKSKKWASLPLPGSEKVTIKSKAKAYGEAEAWVLDGKLYTKLADAEKIPSGAIIFQSETGWNTDVSKSHGNDMGIVRDGGKHTFNYKEMPPIVYTKAKKVEVVILVPAGSFKQ
jgi:hypothetical protein